jgi:hypothetical protein
MINSEPMLFQNADAAHLFFNKDVFDIDESDTQVIFSYLQHLNFDTCDIVFVDPPYGINLAHWDSPEEFSKWSYPDNIMHLYGTLKDMNLVNDDTVFVLFTPCVTRENALLEVYIFSFYNYYSMLLIISLIISFRLGFLVSAVMILLS